MRATKVNIFEEVVKVQDEMLLVIALSDLKEGLNVLNANHESPLAVAAKVGNLLSVKTLIDKGVTLSGNGVGDVLFWSIEHPQVLTYLKAFVEDPKVLFQNGDITLAHIECALGNAAFFQGDNVKLLTKPNRLGITPAFYAYLTGKEEILKLLNPSDPLIVPISSKDKVNLSLDDWRSLALCFVKLGVAFEELKLKGAEVYFHEARKILEVPREIEIESDKILLADCRAGLVVYEKDLMKKTNLYRDSFINPKNDNFNTPEGKRVAYAFYCLEPKAVDSSWARPAAHFIAKYNELYSTISQDMLKAIIKYLLEKNYFFELKKAIAAIQDKSAEYEKLNTVADEHIQDQSLRRQAAEPTNSLETKLTFLSKIMHKSNPEMSDQNQLVLELASKTEVIEKKREFLNFIVDKENLVRYWEAENSLSLAKLYKEVGNSQDLLNLSQKFIEMGKLNSNQIKNFDDYIQYAIRKLIEDLYYVTQTKVPESFVIKFNEVLLELWWHLEAEAYDKAIALGWGIFNSFTNSRHYSNLKNTEYKFNQSFFSKHPLLDLYIMTIQAALATQKEGVEDRLRNEKWPIANVYNKLRNEFVALLAPPKVTDFPDRLDFLIRLFTILKMTPAGDLKWAEFFELIFKKISNSWNLNESPKIVKIFEDIVGYYSEHYYKVSYEVQSKFLSAYHFGLNKIIFSPLLEMAGDDHASFDVVLLPARQWKQYANKNLYANIRLYEGAKEDEKPNFRKKILELAKADTLKHYFKLFMPNKVLNKDFNKSNGIGLKVFDGLDKLFDELKNYLISLNKRLELKRHR